MDCGPTHELDRLVFDIMYTDHCNSATVLIIIIISIIILAFQEER